MTQVLGFGLALLLGGVLSNSASSGERSNHCPKISGRYDPHLLGLHLVVRQVGCEWVSLEAINTWDGERFAYVEAKADGRLHRTKPEYEKFMGKGYVSVTFTASTLEINFVADEADPSPGSFEVKLDYTRVRRSGLYNLEVFGESTNAAGESRARGTSILERAH